jgi:hypothetical protein
LPDVVRPPVGGIAFICGKEIAPGVASLARCDAPASFPGFASWPLTSVDLCRRRDASTRRAGFSICWMRIDGASFSSEELRLPGVRWRDLARAQP